MPKFTDKQQAFIDGKAAGLKNAAAATAAGYASTSAAVTASQLLARDDIKKAVAAGKRKLRSAGAPIGKPDKAEDEDIPDRNKMPKATYSDAKEFLLDAMNHPLLPIAVRGDYAKALLPYQHGRVGETGKKQSQKERAAEVASGGKANKFAPKSAPGGNVVAIRR